MEINESRLTFRFAGSSALKFDDTPFYREHFNGLPGSKGVDILYDSAEWFVHAGNQKLRGPRGG